MILWWKGLHCGRTFLEAARGTVHLFTRAERFEAWTTIASSVVVEEQSVRHDTDSLVSSSRVNVHRKQRQEVRFTPHQQDIILIIMRIFAAVALASAAAPQQFQQRRQTQQPKNIVWVRRGCSSDNDVSMFDSSLALSLLWWFCCCSNYYCISLPFLLRIK